MDEQPAPVFWALLAVPFLALLAIQSVRWVPPGHLLVVTRRGVVSRVTGAGLRLRWPIADHAEVIEVAAQELPLLVRGTTRDGSDVRLLVAAHVRLLPPSPLERYLDPLPSAETAARDALAGCLRRLDVAALPDALLRDWSGIVSTVDAATRPRGVRVLGLSLTELDVVLPTRPACGDPTGAHGPG